MMIRMTMRMAMMTLTTMTTMTTTTATTMMMMVVVIAHHAKAFFRSRPQKNILTESTGSWYPRGHLGSAPTVNLTMRMMTYPCTRIHVAPAGRDLAQVLSYPFTVR